MTFREEEKERYTQLVNIVKAITAHLPGWGIMKEKPGDDNAWPRAWVAIVCGALQLHFSWVARDAKRIQVRTGAWPTYERFDGYKERVTPYAHDGFRVHAPEKYRHQSWDITLSATRAPASAARDIQRRLIDAYSEVYDTMSEVARAQHKEVTQGLDFKKRVQKQFPGMSTNTNAQAFQPDFYYYPTGDGCSRIAVKAHLYDASVDIDIHGLDEDSELYVIISRALRGYIKKDKRRK